MRALPQERRDQEDASSGFLMSKDEQRLKLQRGIAANLEQTLYTLDGVREARVHVNLPERDPLLGRETTPGSASVLIVFEGSRTIEKDDVARLVAGAAGISVASVSVLSSKVEALAPVSTEQAVAPLASELVLPQTAAQTSLSIPVIPSMAAPQANFTLAERHSSQNPVTEIAISLVILGIAGALAVIKAQRRKSSGSRKLAVQGA